MLHRFTNKYYFYTYYSDILRFYGTVVVITNKGIFDIYNLSGVSLSTNATIKINPSNSLGSAKSEMYCHNRNGKYDMQVLFQNQYSHGIVLLGGSILVYDDIVWYEE